MRRLRFGANLPRDSAGWQQGCDVKKASRKHGTENTITTKERAAHASLFGEHEQARRGGRKQYVNANYRITATDPNVPVVHFDRRHAAPQKTVFAARLRRDG